jgi:hypothetical protein
LVSTRSPRLQPETVLERSLPWTSHFFRGEHSEAKTRDILTLDSLHTTRSRMRVLLVFEYYLQTRFRTTTTTTTTSNNKNKEWDEERIHIRKER